MEFRHAKPSDDKRCWFTWPVESIIKLLTQPIGSSRVFRPNIYRSVSAFGFLHPPIGSSTEPTSRERLQLADHVHVRNRCLQASGEIFAITLVLTWTITLIWYPEQIFNHPARYIIGSFNPCFGWDFAPAAYFGLTFCSVNVFLLWRFVWFRICRIRLKGGSETSCPFRFAIVADIMLAISSNTWLLLWIIGPTDGNWLMHTALFIFFAVASQWSCLGNYLEARSEPKRYATITWTMTWFQVFYGWTTTFIALAYFSALALAVPGQEPAIPAWVTQSVDIVWLICQSLVGHFEPKDVPLKLTVELVSEEEESLLP